MTPYYQDDAVTLYLGDCREVLRTVSSEHAVIITDPPYGISYRTPPSAKRPKSGMVVVGDDVPFDPSHLLLMDVPTLLFGANHFADRLPASAGWVVWDKRYGMESNDQSDAELAWTNILGSVRTIRVMWNGGGSLLSENGPARCIHPTQKPIALIDHLVVMLTKHQNVVIDPYMGTGTTLVAAKRHNRKAIGIEINEAYCEIAAKRLSQGALPLDFSA